MDFVISNRIFFFQKAIRFVLSDAYTNLSREERQQLLHEGSGTAVMSGYVEIIFDNSDGRIPSPNKEVSIRRTIGLKKDDYSLEKKSCSRTDVMNLLESAGFSKSNPYYIVPQGRVTALTNAKDPERLKLLKEVAGTQVYEQRREESLKVLADTETKREKIQELLEFIEERLNELEDEKKELKEYQEKDREKRCLDYSLLERELNELNETLLNLEELRANGLENINEHVVVLNNLEEHINVVEKEIADLKQRDHTLQLDKGKIDEDLEHAVRDQTDVELKIAELDTDKEYKLENRHKLENDLMEINSTINTKELELRNIQPEYAQSKEQEAEIHVQLSSLESRQHHLQLKQGRNSKFKSKNERDPWIKKEMSDIKGTIDSRSKAASILESDLADLNDQYINLSSSTEQLLKQLNAETEKQKSLKHSKTQTDRKNEDLKDERRNLWRELSKVEYSVDAMKEQLSTCEHRVSETMSREMSMGLKSVQRITERLKLDGVYGTLADIIEVDDKYKMAVEVTAGNSLFHVVVDNEDTASTILEQLSRDKAGRATCMPLNRLKPKDLTYPDSNEAIPLVSKIKHDEKFLPAINQVFGKTLVCRNLETGQQFASEYNLNAITLSGDQVDIRGVLTGGYHDNKKSRIDAVRQLQDARATMQEGNTMLNDIKKQISTKDQEINLAFSEINKVSASYQQVLRSVEGLERALRSNSSEQSEIQKLIESKTDSLNSIQADLTTLRQQYESFKNDLASGFEQSLSNMEIQELEDSYSQVPKLKRQLKQAAAARGAAEEHKTLLEVEIGENLYIVRDRLKSKLSEQNQSNGDGGDDLDDDSSDRELKRQLKQYKDQVRKCKNQTEKIEKEIEEIQIDLETKQNEVEQSKAKQVGTARSIEKLKKKMENSVSRRTLLTERKEEVQAKIRELGVLPEDAFTRFRQLASQTILERSRELADELKKFSHVNKKAVEQFNNFTRQREQLNSRQVELEKSYNSIEDLIETLDQRKDEAIERTFKQVSKGFSEIFQKLVPAGFGRLIMQRRSDSLEDDNSDDDEHRHRSSVENYSGVAISVSFNSKNDEQQRIEQLSGGQKSLCALTLIFAIQQCDPAPFYLFDEIDANLDTQYRTAVAAMVKELSTDGQFICTTFRNEMLQVANNFYGVLFDNRMSTIASITKEDAMSFVEGEQQTS